MKSHVVSLYAVYDKKADAYSSYHSESSDAVATRAFAEAVQQPNSVYARYADDFEFVALCDLPTCKADVTPPFGEWQLNHRVVITARQVVDSLPAKVSSPQLNLLGAEG